MSERNWSVVRPSSLVIFSLLAILSLAAAGPLAAQQATATPTPAPRALCTRDSSVMGWDQSAATGTTFTMTKDCYIEHENGTVFNFLVPQDKNFIIEGAGFTIYAASKSSHEDLGTAFTLDRRNAALTLRNLTIEGGGTATGATRAGNTPDPAIVFQTSTVVLDNVTIQNTRGGAIRIQEDGTLTLKDSTFTGNQVSGAGSANEGSVVTANNDVRAGTVILQGTLTMKNNTGGVGAINIKTDVTLTLSALTCKDLSGNTPAGSSTETPLKIATIPAAWTAVPNKGSCPGDATPTPAPGGNTGGGGPSGGSGTMMSMGDKRAMNDSNYGRRIAGMIGSRSAYYRINSGGVVTLQIYRVDGNSVGHWVMDVSQAAVDALGGPGCVASSPDGRYAVRVWADGNVTVSDGPDHENKVLHNTLMGGVSGMVIATETTYSSTPPGMGCPGYMG